MGVELNQNVLKHCVILIAILAVPLGVQSQTQLTFQGGATLSEFIRYFVRSDVKKPGTFVQLGVEQKIHQKHSLLSGVAYAAYNGQSGHLPKEGSQMNWGLNVLELPVGWRWYLSQNELQKKQFFLTTGIIPSILLNNSFTWEVSDVGVIEDSKMDLRRFYLGSFLEVGAKQKLSEKASLLLCLRGSLSLTRLRTTDGSKLGNYAALTPTLGLAYRL